MANTEQQGAASSSQPEKNDNPRKRPADHDNTSSTSTSTGDNQAHNKSGDENKMVHGDDQKMKPSITSQQKHEDPNSIKQDGDLESTKAEMGEVMEENLRLKQHLDRIMKDYQALQMKYYEIAQQDSNKPKNTNNTTTHAQVVGDDEDEAELVSLSLGRTSSLDSRKSITKQVISTNINSSNKEKDEAVSRSKISSNNDEARERSLALGLDCKFESLRNVSLDHQMPTSSHDNSIDETTNEEVGGKETWSPSTAPKNSNTRSGGGDDEVLQQPPVKKARVSVRARCDTPTMNDGCQWRKYGQKIAKGNPCPRAYYRCTVAPSCPVRKQVQRCAEDMSILITTYEGTHNHSLPISATAMASTTSAAAYMLMSGSSTSSHGSNEQTTTTIPTTGAELASGLNFNILNNSSSKPFYLPNSSTTFSPAPTHPTITLDLTSTTSSSTTQFNRATSSTFAPKYSSTNLTFNSSDVSNNTLPSSWSNGLVNYGTQPYNKTQVSALDIGLSRHHPHHDNTSFNLHTLLPKSNLSNPSNQQPIPDTIAQAAKVLTSDPNFQTVLTAALSSFISNNNGTMSGGIVGNNSLNVRENNNSNDFAQQIKWGGVQTSSCIANSTLQSASKGTNGCGSSLLSMAPSSTNSKPAGSLAFLSPPLPFSGSKSASSSPVDNIDHAN